MLPALSSSLFFLFFFFNDPATTEIYTLSLHDALPISGARRQRRSRRARGGHDDVTGRRRHLQRRPRYRRDRSEEHTSELQSRQYLVCRLLLEKKKKKQETHKLNIEIRARRDTRQKRHS